MTDPRFFAPVGPLTLGELAERTGTEIADGAGDLRLDVAPHPTRPLPWQRRLSTAAAGTAGNRGERRRRSQRLPRQG
jgi:hypothetical protein